LFDRLAEGSARIKSNSGCIIDYGGFNLVAEKGRLDGLGN